MTDPLAQSLIERLRRQGRSLAVAESCTAGRLSHLLSQCEGAARQFHGGFVVYTPEQKSMALGVPQSLIAKHSAVSAPVAVAMASGVLDQSPANYAVAITGVAGPEPDDDGNPVGLVFTSVAARGRTAEVRRHQFSPRQREDIEAQAIHAALRQLLEFIEGQTGRSIP